MSEATVDSILAALEPLRHPAVVPIFERQGAGPKILGVKLGDLRTLAGKHKKAHALGLALWDAGWYETRVMATMMIDPKQLDEAASVRLAESADTIPTLDKLTDYVLPLVKAAPALRERWLDDPDPLLRRAGWNLMTTAVEKDAKDQLDKAALLARIEAELPGAPTKVKESMNHCLVMIGVYHEAHRAAALAAGERLGRWDDRPVPKGCTSSYPADWIPAAIRLREGRKR